MSRTKGAVVENPTPRSERARAWALMRNFKQRSHAFTRADLMARLQDGFGPVDNEGTNLKRYLRALYNAGYLRHVKAVKGQNFEYRLIRDSGPLSPIVRSAGGVFDPNDKTLYGVEDAA